MDAPHPIQLCNILTALRRNDIEPQGAFGIAEGSRGIFWKKMAHPQKVPSFKRGPKEDERVAQGHFHKRVDECPRRCEKLAQAYLKISFCF